MIPQTCCRIGTDTVESRMTKGHRSADTHQKVQRHGEDHIQLTADKNSELVWVSNKRCNSHAGHDDDENDCSCVEILFHTLHLLLFFLAEDTGRLDDQYQDQDTEADEVGS